MSDVKAKAEERKTALEQEFKETEVRVNFLNTQIGELNRQLSLTRQRQVQLQGAFQEIKRFLDEETPGVPDEQSPS